MYSELDSFNLGFSLEVHKFYFESICFAHIDVNNYVALGNISTITSSNFGLENHFNRKVIVLVLH